MWQEHLDSALFYLLLHFLSSTYTASGAALRFFRT
jgi:hypothetical protein